MADGTPATGCCWGQLGVGAPRPVKPPGRHVEERGDMPRSLPFLLMLAVVALGGCGSLIVPQLKPQTLAAKRGFTWTMQAFGDFVIYVEPGSLGERQRRMALTLTELLARVYLVDEPACLVDRAGASLELLGVGNKDVDRLVHGLGHFGAGEPEPRRRGHDHDDDDADRSESAVSVIHGSNVRCLRRTASCWSPVPRPAGPCVVVGSAETEVTGCAAWQPQGYCGTAGSVRISHAAVAAPASAPP